MPAKVIEHVHVLARHSHASNGLEFADCTGQMFQDLDNDSDDESYNANGDPGGSDNDDDAYPVNTDANIAGVNDKNEENNENGENEYDKNEPDDIGNELWFGIQNNKPDIDGNIIPNISKNTIDENIITIDENDNEPVTIDDDDNQPKTKQQPIMGTEETNGTANDTNVTQEMETKYGPWMQ
jgi:hypothetical protein